MTSATAVPTLTFHDGHAIPQLGFGVFRVDAAETERVVGDALSVGYRHIDTAAAYRNEEAVGSALAKSGIDRSELFITTKLWNDRHLDAAAAFDESLGKLGLDYVDLYLIHWPVAAHDNYVAAWEALVKIAESGRARSIGVSNFNEREIQRLIDETGQAPVIDQVETHPDFQQAPLRAYLDSHNILHEAWFPLGGGKFNESDALGAIADAHGKSRAQVILRWHMQSGRVAIPKSSHRERMAENFNIFDFDLSADELAKIAALDRGADGRNGPDPADMK